jgi:hypothetical protein
MDKLYVLTYVFQKSSDNSNFVPIGSAAVINNPSVGSSNTVTYALTLADMPAFTLIIVLL